jgi:hypothetical protein
MALLNQLFGYGAPGLGQTQSITPSTYQSLSSISLPLAIPSIAPLATIPINDTNSSAQGVDVPDHGLKEPYIQNWNASLGREIAKGLVVDLRYVGSKGTKLIQSVNINEVNIFENGILNAFQVTEAGGNSAPRSPAPRPCARTPRYKPTCSLTMSEALPIFWAITRL